ncbi:hsp70-like protein [Colletotrichum nymphaeae SA-01]|uniref:Hsp70-like protein n=1 Tax=Colletotrichum nymphaeae SA-01 TaxID=1460502 RepID=A0A135URX2_9PEZI|nr:hsp70-like protein [Colletotrichum nymphaeae SA-01]
MSSFLIVDAAKNQVAMNPHHTMVFNAKRLIGRKFQDCGVHDDGTH